MDREIKIANELIRLAESLIKEGQEETSPEPNVSDVVASILSWQCERYKILLYYLLEHASEEDKRYVEEEIKRIDEEVKRELEKLY